MANEISRAEAWTRAHEVFTRVNFNAFDFNTIKESLLDYMKLYFPEDFNDYIESSEFIAILELFAYVGEILAYRIDLNAHENFITTAERKESILRLAKLISYNSSRNIAARGLVKITSIQTTEQVIDSKGNNLANTNVKWNDLNNTNWKSQFLLVMNRVLEQPFGTVTPNERVQIEDVLFELYTWNNQQLKGNGITTFDYSIESSGSTFPLELVPVSLTSSSPIERRPERDLKFSLLYGSDGLGDGSDTTGFFLYTKQGSLQVREKSFDGVTLNQTYKLAIDNINETDVWVNNVDPDTRKVLDINPFSKLVPHLDNNTGKYGEWSKVDQSSAQNILFNTDKNRQKYETETLDKDQVKLVFGDGEFSDIPNGDFDIWYRVSANSNSIIQKTAGVDLTASFSYLDITNTIQTFTFTFSLINSLQNGSVSEDIDHVRRVAPSVYYTQDRMVNGRDYNSFMLKDPSILKLKSVNRTFAGDSKYITWHDPKEYYENVKIFGDDLALYWVEKDINNGGLNTATTALVSDAVIVNMIEPLLCSADIYNIMVGLFDLAGKTYTEHCTFTVDEYSKIKIAVDLAAVAATPQVDLYFSALRDEWTVDANTNSFDSILLIRVEAQFTASNLAGWSVRWATKRMSAQSQNTRFRNSNTTTSIINYDTLRSTDDTITILKANVNGKLKEVLPENKNYNVMAQELVEHNNPNAGLPDDNKLSVLPEDKNADGIPDGLEQSNLLNATHTWTGLTGQTTIDFVPVQPLPPLPPITSETDEMYFMNGTEAESVIVKINGQLSTDWTAGSTVDPVYPSIVTSINITKNLVPTDIVEITTKVFVYFSRPDITDPWVPIADTDNNRSLWAGDVTGLYKREYGRYPLNFAWFYTTPRFHLVDPAASNIIDTFIITAGYYQGITRWLENKSDIKPDVPTPLDLRTTYDSLLQNSMISDTVILHPGKIKILFGSRAEPELRAKFKIIRPAITNLTDNEVKVRIVNTIKAFFTIDDWDFGSTFFFTEMATAIHTELGAEIKSVVLVPTYITEQFGDLFQVQSSEDEIFVVDISTNDMEVIQSFTTANIRQ